MHAAVGASEKLYADKLQAVVANTVLSLYF